MAENSGPALASNGPKIVDPLNHNTPKIFSPLLRLADPQAIINERSLYYLVESTHQVTVDL